jgi:hypothetical protein
VVLVPDPDIDPGLIVQLPEGRPLNSTLPVATAHVGCVIVPTIGAEGGGGMITIFNTSTGLLVSSTSPEAVPPTPSSRSTWTISPAVHAVGKFPHWTAYWPEA